MNTENEKTETATDANTVLPAVRVNWYIKANAECPHCLHYNDFMEVDEWWAYCKTGETVDKFHSPVELECKKCGKEFIVDGSDY